MPLDEHARRVIERFTAAGATPFDELTVEEARRNSVERFRDTDGPPEPVARVEERRSPGPSGGIPLRLYYPEAPGPLPVMLYFHGGGWVLCSLDTHDTVCRRLANAARRLVVSVDYRLAPEYPFPAAVEDSWAATQWVAENAGALGGDPTRVSVAGDSAGGNLAAVVALLARDAGRPRLASQLLVAPVIEYLPDNRSYRDNGEGFLLTRAFMAWFFRHYLQRRQDAHDWRAIPALAPSVAGLPPAVILTAEYDPLRDEGEAWARRLAAAGVPTAHRRFEGTIHQFFSMSQALPQGREAMAWAAAALREVSGG